MEGIIFGLEMMSGNVLSLPVDSKLNRNIAVCGSQGVDEVQGICQKHDSSVCQAGERVCLSLIRSLNYMRIWLHI